MQNFFYELSSNSFLLILVLIWVVPLLIAGFIGIIRLRRVYQGLQMPVYPGKRRGELFDWTHGPKTPRAALLAVGGNLCLAGLYSWLLTNPASRNSPARMLIMACGIAVFSVRAALNYQRFRRLGGQTGATVNLPQTSGAARKIYRSP